MLVLKIRCLKIYSSIILWMKLPPFQILFSRRETNKTKLIIVLMLVAHFCSSQMLQRKCISISVCMLIFTDMLEVKITIRTNLFYLLSNTRIVKLWPIISMDVTVQGGIVTFFFYLHWKTEFSQSFYIHSYVRLALLSEDIISPVS